MRLVYELKLLVFDVFNGFYWCLVNMMNLASV